MFLLRRLRRRLLESQIREQESLEIKAQRILLPSENFPIAVVREGSRWMCTFPCVPDPMQCVTAYGDSPAQACANFDALWNGAVLELEEPEEEF